MKSTKSKLIAIGGVILLLVVAAGFWAKADADSKAEYYTQAVKTDFRELSTKFDKLNGSTFIQTDKKDTDSVDDAPDHVKACEYARGVEQGFQSLAQRDLEASIGASFSSKYEDAEALRKKLEPIEITLQEYAGACEYYASDAILTHERNGIINSAAYQNTRRTPAFADQYERVVDIYKKQAAYVKEMKCPFNKKDEREVCARLQTVLAQRVTDAETYVQAWRSGDSQRIREANEFREFNKQFNAMVGYIKDTLDEDVNGINHWWKKYLETREAQLRSAEL